MKELFMKIFEMSLTASLVACAVILMRLLLKKAPKKFSYALWGVVLFRLICPFTFESAFSLMPANVNNLIIAQAPATPENMPVQDRAADAVQNSIVNVTQNQTTVLIPTSFVAPATPIDTVQIVSYIWAAGVVLMFGYALFSYMRLKLRLKTATLKRGIVYETDRIIAPFVLGVLKPKIYLPAGTDGADYILKHERTHIRRGDYLVKPAAFCVFCLHWFNPIIWLSYTLMCRDMEMSCDESVLKQSARDIRKDYSDSLLALSVKQSGLFGLLAFGENSTRTRIRNVLKYKKPSLLIRATAILVILCVMFLLVPNGIESQASSVSESNEANMPAPDTQDYFSTLPDTKTIPVTREGMTNELSANLFISNQGYAMYLFEGYTLAHIGRDDIILPETADIDNYPLLPTYIRIYDVNAEEHTVDAALNFPYDAEESTAVLLRTMRDTIVWPDGVTVAADPSLGPFSATPVPDGFAALPDTKTIAVTREGVTEDLPTYLAISEQGYAMYLFDWFVMVPTADGDIIQTAINPNPNNMRIFNVDAAAQTFDTELNYPPGPEGGNAVLLRAMRDTIVWPERRN